MLFHKKKNKKEDDIDIKISHEKVSDYYLEKIKPLERKQRMKHYFLVCLIAIGLFGGFKALMPGIDDQEALAVSETQTFVKTYITNYFMYPKTDETSEYFKIFSLDESWEMQYNDKDIKSATASNVEIYKVSPDRTDNRYADYYLYLTNHLVLKDESEKDITFNVLVRLFKENESYLVSAPVQMVSLDIQGIDDDHKKELQLTQSKGSEQVDEAQKKELENTISLFLDTYSSNYDQAQLLVSMKDGLDALDRNTKMKMDSIVAATKDSSFYFVEAQITETLGEIIVNKKKIHFEIDIEKNKITEMEEY